MSTVRESISRVRNVLKAVKEDAFMTDRFIYSLLTKYGKTLVKRESKIENLYKHSSLFKEIPCVELIDVDKVEACCLSIRTGLTFKRSKDKLPAITNVDSGPIIRSVSTLDYSQALIQTLPDLYATMTKSKNFKYNKTKYFWYLDGHIFIPDVAWEGVRLQAMFEDDISSELCNIAGDTNECIIEQDKDFLVPEHLFSEMEQMVLNEILTTGRIPADGVDDQQNVLR